jgi:hypothetical protein
MVEKRINFVDAVEYLSGIVTLHRESNTSITPRPDRLPPPGKGPPGNNKR